MTERQRTVALLIDYDNLQICYSRDAPGTQLDLGAVMALAQNYGRVVVARAYAEWNLLSERLAVYKAGIEPAFAPVMRAEGSNREGKSLADTVMVSDGVDLLWTHEPDVLVLVTSDKDMIPLARLAKQRGTLVVVLGSDLTAVQLLEMANDFVTYRHLIKELGRPEDRLASAQVREEPRLRRAAAGTGDREVDAARELSQRAPRTTPGRSRTRSTAIPLPAPAAVLESATSVAADSAPVAASPQLDENGQPLPPRRRRRRGGRGRRTGSALEANGQPTGEDGIESTDASGTAEAGLTGQVLEQEAVLDETLEQEPASTPAPRTRRRRTTRASAASAEPEPAAEPVVELPLNGEPPDAVRLSTDDQSAPSPPALRPWERWPEPPGSTRSLAGVGGTTPEPAAPIGLDSPTDGQSPEPAAAVAPRPRRRRPRRTVAPADKTPAAADD